MNGSKAQYGRIVPHFEQFSKRKHLTVEQAISWNIMSIQRGRGDREHPLGVADGFLKTGLTRTLHIILYIHYSKEDYGHIHTNIIVNTPIITASPLFY
jgi:hypothetical protein